MARSALHHRYVALGATFERSHGWDLPVRFAYGDAARAEAAPVMLADESAVGKFQLEGSELKAVSTAFPSVSYAIKPGVSLVIVPVERRTAATEKFIVGSPGCLHAVDVSSAFSSFVVAGPYIPEVFAKLATTDLSSVAAGGSVACGLAGLPCIVGRHARGWRILSGRDVAEDLWDHIVSASPEIVIASWTTVREWLW